MSNNEKSEIYNNQPNNEWINHCKLRAQQIRIYLRECLRLGKWLNNYITTIYSPSGSLKTTPLVIQISMVRDLFASDTNPQIYLSHASRPPVELL